MEHSILRIGARRLCRRAIYRLPTSTRSISTSVADATSPLTSGDGNGPEIIRTDEGMPGPELSRKHVSKNPGRISPALLRDSCTCHLCVNPSTKQKNYQTGDIPADIKYKDFQRNPDSSWTVTWINDIPGVGPEHVSEYSKESVIAALPPTRFDSQAIRMIKGELPPYRTWGANRIRKELEYFNYEDYMRSDESLFRVLYKLSTHGLVLFRGVPESEKSVENLASRIGNIKDTFYGRTWDVKSVPEPKNVAYTHQNLGLHMDLLYFRSPPGLQFLHCLKNSCEGGASVFSDSFLTAERLDKQAFKTLSNTKTAFHYHNDGEYYKQSHPLIEVGDTVRTVRKPNQETPLESYQRKAIKHVNYSPPFQAPMMSTGGDDQAYHLAVKEFTKWVGSEKNLLEYRLQEGECVLFNNRRVLHGRRAFETEAGERWLKGTYIDTDAFESRYRAMSEKLGKTPEDLSSLKASQNLVFETPN